MDATEYIYEGYVFYSDGDGACASIGVEVDIHLCAETDYGAHPDFPGSGVTEYAIDGAEVVGLELEDLSEYPSEFRQIHADRYSSGGCVIDGQRFHTWADFENYVIRCAIEWYNSTC